ncbi:glycosyltransferase [Streptomyces spinoverrucosus]|uniref:glycosyltransferase n=1 Tax=Streptomyces spinoverrucosus TaxID=284043 RepID=UPI0018C3B916|nr:glycosyltransferase [Streptomyces spinoverrucosus]MBG0852505.1 glycosyltransferase [Streptomyces spinoverrucosus]
MSCPGRVVVGDSGGAPDTVRDGETGHVVDGTSAKDVADRLTELLLDAEAARTLGEKGRAWVCREWGWDRSYKALAGLLSQDRERHLSRPESPSAI